jgi:HK97 gp10 family phage protein
VAVIVNMERGWQEKMRPHIDDFMDELAGDVAKTARHLAPVDTGFLKANIRVSKRVTPGGGLRIGRRITAHANYAAYVELGTSAHIIRPRFKKALWWEGAPHPISPSVRHPGAKAKPFLRPALYHIRMFNGVT